MAARLFVAAVILAGLFAQLGAIGLMGPDEPRYAWIARAMAQTGDWITPRLYGRPWFEKPVLYYWAAGIGFRLHFSSEWAARLPSAVAALAAAIAIAWLAREFYGRSNDWARDPAILSGLIFATTVAAVGFARAATPDMLFSASITLAMSCAGAVLINDGALRAPATSGPSWRAHRSVLLALAGAFLGLGVLAKGPAAAILAVGALCVWAAAGGHANWRAAARLAHPAAVATFCAVALPWYVLCALRNPDFLRVFILQHNFERYLTPVFQHKQPFWFFGPIILVAMLPWSALLWPVVNEGLRLKRQKSWTASPGFFLACWAVFPVAFFSFSDSKLPSYILPSIPPLAMLCAIGWIRTIETGRKRVAQVAAALAATWVALGVAAFVLVERLSAADGGFGPAERESTPHLVYVALGLTFAGAMAVAFLGLRNNPRRVLGLSAALFLVSVQLANAELLPQIEERLSARSYANFLRNDVHPDRIFIYQIPRAWDYGLAFYFGRELPEWSASDPAPALVLATPKGLAEIRAMGRSSAAEDEIPAKQPIVFVPVGASARHTR